MGVPFCPIAHARGGERGGWDSGAIYSSLELCWMFLQAAMFALPAIFYTFSSRILCLCQGHELG